MSGDVGGQAWRALSHRWDLKLRAWISSPRESARQGTGGVVSPEAFPHLEVELLLEKEPPR